MGNFITDMAEADSGVINAPNTESLSEISKLAAKLSNLVAEAASVSNYLEVVTKQIKQIEEYDLPELMLGVGMSAFTLADGKKISIKKFYSAKISPSCEQEAFSWLEENGHSSIIKNTISLDFGKGENDAAEKLSSILSDMGYHYNQKIGVHPSTLRAFVKEQVEAGAALPLETFGVYIGNRATIK